MKKPPQHKKILAVRCPTCGTASGENCELTSGQPRPKENGKQRPISIPALEDKLVQKVMVEILSAIYEQDFLDCSYGFRPGRGAHHALDEVKRIFCTRSRKRWKEAKGSLQPTKVSSTRSEIRFMRKGEADPH